MGRAIVREPEAFLMDEPLSNLDAKLRVQMRAEIQKLQRTLGVTTIYVTHDQTEAMTMGDRIAVMRGGTLQQVDTPERVYRWPANQFVAGFIGSPAMNMVGVHLARVDGKLRVVFGSYSLTVDDELVAAHPELLAHEGRDVILGIRPEDFEDAAFVPDPSADSMLDVVCSLREALGSEILLHFPIAPTADSTERFEAETEESSMFVARVNPHTAVREGDRVSLVADTKRLQFFDPDTGSAICGAGDRRPGAVPA
jgi:multiple sugar transport system ATP-binding protein